MSAGKYAIFVSASWNYVPFLNTLLNSLDSYGLNIDVHFIGYQIHPAYVRDARRAFNFEIYYHEVKTDEFDIAGIEEPGKNLFIKQSRFKYILDHGKEYDAICMLDADMFVSSTNFLNFFDLVKGTDKLIGCEESYKWAFDKKYQSRGKELFNEPVKALKFMCSVPIIFDLNKWEDVFRRYNDMAFHSWEMEGDQKKKRIGDIYTWSMAVYLCGRQNDCVLYPMHGMTQVHGTAGAFWCALQNHNGKWHALDGIEVYTIHGRVGTENWRQSQINWYTNSLKSQGIEYRGKMAQICEKSLDAIEKEWYRLNFAHKVKINDYFNISEWWQTKLTRYGIK